MVVSVGPRFLIKYKYVIHQLINVVDATFSRGNFENFLIFWCFLDGQDTSSMCSEGSHFLEKEGIDLNPFSRRRLEHLLSFLVVSRLFLRFWDYGKCRRNFRSEFCKLPVEDISFPRGCNGINKWANQSTIYSKGTPIHVRGSLLYNFYNKKNKLIHKYPLIQDGEKIKFVYLKTPNKINENVISFLQTLPKEFGLDKQVDYDLQFQKSFLEPIKVIMDTIGWKPEKVANLEFLFG